jgi:HEAT repeat protein
VRKHRKLFVPFACLAAFITLLVLVSDHEPTYRGRTLSKWLATYQADASVTEKYMPVDWRGHTPTARQKEAAAAVRHIGTNAIPWLLKRLRYEKQPLKWTMLLQYTKFTRHLREKIFVQAVEPYEVRNSALLGFALLGDDASSAAPSLLRLAEDEDTDRAYRALGALSCLGERGVRELMAVAADPQSPNQILAINQFAAMRRPGCNASPAVPILVRCAADGDPETARAAIFALCNLGEQFNLCFPVFTNALASTNTDLRAFTIHHLGYFGSSAVLQPLTPCLINCLKDPDALVRIQATQALTYIAPGVLTNAEAK